MLCTVYAYINGCTALLLPRAPRPLFGVVWCDVVCSSQLQLEAVQIRVKAATSAVTESKQYLSKLPESLKDVEKALVPLRK